MSRVKKRRYSCRRSPARHLSTGLIRLWLNGA
jgi:hypothetical protein